MQYDYTYDSTDRLISSTITNSNNNQRKAMFEYNFDLNNNMSKFITLTPTGHNKVLYTYGKDNLLTGMTLNNQKTLSFVYDGIGRPTSHTVNLTNPLTTAYTYHGITSGGTVYKNNLIRTEKIGNGDFWYLYHYDANNNINRLYQNAENEDNKVLLEDYSYDALNQLENVNYYDRHERHVYTYDNGGNITEEKVYDTSGATPVLTATNTYTYGDNSWGDLLTEYNGDTITYDEIGNPLNYRDEISFTWGNGRQLQSYTKNNSTINYTYDSSGMRLSKDVGNTHYTYLYQNGLLVQETIGEKILDYSYTSGGQILSVRYKTNANDSGVYYYYALNSRGDVVGLYDHTGALYAKYTYDVWGNSVSVTNASGTEITSPTDFANLQSIRYRSYYYDSDTGLYYNQARYYDPVTHRFINADDVDIPELSGSNVYNKNQFSYCDNNPVIRKDDNGDFWHIVVGAAIGAVVGTVSAVLSGGDLGDAIIGGLAGAAGGALAATGIGVIGQAIGSAAISMASNAAQQLNHMYISTDPNLKQDRFDVGDMLFDGAVGFASGAAGGKGASYGNSKSITSSGKQYLKRGIFNSKAHSYYVKTAHNMEGKYVLRALRQSLKKSYRVTFAAVISKRAYRRYTK